MFTQNSSNKDSFLKQANEAREKRTLEKKRLASAIKIQSFFRGYLARKKFSQGIESDLNSAFDGVDIQDKETLMKRSHTSKQLLELIDKILFFKKIKARKAINLDEKLIGNFTSYMILNITNGDFKHSYMSLILSKDNYQKFLTQSHKVLKLLVDNLDHLNIKDLEHNKIFNNIIRLFTVLSDNNQWKCFPISNRNEMLDKTLKEISKNYILALKHNSFFEKLMKPLIQNASNHITIISSNVMLQIHSLTFNIFEHSSFDSNDLYIFCSTLLTIPLFFKILEDNSSKNSSENDANELILKSKIKSSGFCQKIYSILTDTGRIKTFLSSKNDVNLMIAFLGNICSLSVFDFESLKINIEKFIAINHQVFLNASEIISPQAPKIHVEKNHSIKWHPIFGYLKIKTCLTNYEIFNKVLDQLKFLWSHRLITILFDFKYTINEENLNNKNNFKIYLKNFFDKVIDKQSNLINSSQSVSVYRICSFYRQFLFLINEPRIEILSALSIENEFLLGLWGFVTNIGPMCGLRDLIRLLETSRDFSCHPVFDVYYILCSLILYLVTVLDENEFYVKQEVLKLNDYKQIAIFLNNLIYHIIVNELIDLKTIDQNPYFTVFHQLLLSLYVKDCRRPFTENPDEFWIIKDLRKKTFFEDLEKESKIALYTLNKIPHVIPLKYRIEILKNKIEKDKTLVLGEEPTSLKISIKRNRMIEDAYTNLFSLSPNLIKAPIRISFINEFGLKEAGIDQDGVFKEFLQEVVLQLLNPQFNLFKLTSDQFLYPSPASYFVDDHLQMFKFAGKMIGKAVYESLVIDAEFAPFFLRQIAGYRSQFNYSFLDDLATLDQDLYKNLNFIKHDENVDDLELNFTHSESHLGQLITHELVPSGEFIKVTNLNKIKYIHLMAHLKLHRLIKDQVAAFNEGFKSIIKQEWVNMFSVSEIQRLISGCLNDLDLEDLKKNVQYWGGLHSNHRLIKWLWEILENDFSKEERSLFLKFVTSSPKPPLLGFSTLNPPFTIRCVEANEEEGTIYDSSIKGFFKTIMNISGTDTSRLPTSSTCFNLLKLPNYSKKSSLREKLRYAIKSNSGFELS
ncbi:unnamed protein product [Brachionus calyciflorus]|uniref:HECT-type E3 ubiquitin transferase n=1 Tax=Brachionus calyciflorus TaxID=104777 RepID=A0A813YEI2_9BILA|nr:unnamed protein product [Brachionus calyciflorus]